MNALIAVFFSATSMELGLPEGLLSSMCMVESRHTVHIINKYDGPSHSYGICQIKLATAKDLGYTGDAKGLMEPQTNIKYAGLYLKKQINKYRDLSRAITAYNKGRSNGSGQSIYYKKVLNEWKPKCEGAVYAKCI